MNNFLSKYRLPLIALTLAALIVIADRVSESIISLHINNISNFERVTPFFNLVSMGNDGVSFGMFQNLVYGRWLLSGFALIITSFFFVWLLRTNSLWIACALGLIIGGALGNVFERLVYGHVIDILDFHAFGYHWPAFNINDSAIFGGVTSLIIYEFLKTPKFQKIQGEK